METNDTSNDFIPDHDQTASCVGDTKFKGGLSANAPIDEVQRERLVERHRTFTEHFERYEEPSGYIEVPSWHLDRERSYVDVLHDLNEIANHSLCDPWTSYDQLVLERARSFDLFRYRSTTATAELLGPASDELTDWWELEPDGFRLSTFRAELCSEGVDAVFAAWKKALSASVDKYLLKPHHDLSWWTLADWNNPKQRAKCRQEPKGAWYFEVPVDHQTSATVTYVAESRVSIEPIITRQRSLEFEARREELFLAWWRTAVSTAKVEFPDLDQTTLFAAMNKQRKNVRQWKSTARAGRKRGPYRKPRSGDPGYSPYAQYRSGDVAQLSYHGVPGMRREPLMSSKDEVSLDTWQAVNAFGSYFEITAATRNGKPFAQLSVSPGNTTAREELFEEAKSIGFYARGEEPGAPGLFAGIGEEWKEVSAEKSSGWCEPWRWWRGAALALLVHRNAGRPRGDILESVVQARENLKRRKRAHPLRGTPLPWPLDVVFEKGLTLEDVAKDSWPDDRKDNALVKATRAFRAALNALQKQLQPPEL